MTNLSNTAERAAIVTALRDFADLVESDPTIPTPSPGSIRAWSFLMRDEGTQAQRFTAVHDFAEAHRATVIVKNENDRQAAAHFGPIELTVHAFADEHREIPSIVTRADDPALIAA